MKGLYSSPLRVYLVMGLLAFFGIYCGLQLPVSLFPNSSRPVVRVQGQYGNMTAEEYRHAYGASLEAKLRSLRLDDAQVEEVDANYRPTEFDMRVKFRWGDNIETALRETRNVTSAFAAQWGNSPDYALQTWIWNRNSGFLAVSFFSNERSPDELYRILDPILTPRLQMIADAESPHIYNPQSREVRIELKPEVLTSLQLSMNSIEDSVRKGFETRRGGEVVSAGKILRVIMPRQVSRVEDIGMIPVQTNSGKIVPLRDIASIALAPQTNGSQIFKTNGAASLLLFSSPKPGGNVKAMSEDIMIEVREAMKLLPADVQYRILVDPSEFISSSIENVMHEVLIGSCLAVIVLLIFIGSPKNVATAAIEIPISLVLAFILMRMAKMNINLISLGGLALSAGMNVDASVVVMENIFRHFEKVKGRISRDERLRIIVTAVNEVKGPVIASTIASLVVFLPLAFTSNLSYAILGDLAKAVVFSHAFSALVALVLVPTVRLHIMSREKEVQHPKSPIDKGLVWLESTYAKLLGLFIDPKALKFRLGATAALVLILAGLIAFVLPKLPKEVVGTPDTDWVILGVSSEGNSKIRQMESISDLMERELLEKFGSKIKYTFTEIDGPNYAQVMARLKDKSEMNAVKKILEEHFKNTPTNKFFIESWNPSELPLPEPEHLQIAISGTTPEIRQDAAGELSGLLEGKQVFPRFDTKPGAERNFVISVNPKVDQWLLARASGSTSSLEDVMTQIRVATVTREIDSFPFGKDTFPVILTMSGEPPQSLEDIGTWSVALNSKIAPLRALADIKRTRAPAGVRRINQKEVNYIYASLPEQSQGPTAEERRAQAKILTDEWQKDFNARHPNSDDQPVVQFEDGEKEAHEAIDQLQVAIGWSILLIFLTMVIQFGSIMEPLIVLAAIPLGIIGVLIALYVFKSSLSLNSALGVILLNGIAVANSIILVDFARKLHNEGLPPLEAVIKAARTRLRPILITSLTTVLGMLPVACGFGDGGKVLQPLGIAVAGGLWVSMLLTLFVVPTLHVAYMKFVQRSNQKNQSLTVPVLLLLILVPLMNTSTSFAADWSYAEQIAKIAAKQGDISASDKSTNAARERDKAAAWNYLPTVSVDATRAFAKERVPELSNYHTTDTNAALSMNLFRFGADAAAQDSSHYRYAAAVEKNQLARLDGEAKAAQLIHEAIAASMEAAVYKRRLTTQSQVISASEARFRKGILSEQELTKLKLEASNLSLSMNSAERNALRASSLVAELGATLPDPLVWPIGAKTPSQIQVASISLWVEKLTQNSLDLKALESSAKAADAAVREARGAMMPYVDATAAWSKSYLDGYPTQKDQQRYYVTLTVPLFSRFSDWVEYRARAEEAGAASATLDAARIRSTHEFTHEKKLLLALSDEASQRDKNIEAADKLFHDNLQRFERGLISVNDLSIDEFRLREAELTAIKTWQSLHDELFQVARIAGTSALTVVSK